MKRYEAYDSFLDIWVDEIPSHWETHKMKYLFHERSEKGYPDEPLLVASQNMGVVPKNVYGNRTVEAQKDLYLLKLVRVGDFVISLRSFQGGLEYAYYQGIISPAYTVLTPHEPITAGYFRYLAKSKLFIGLLTLCVTGIREGQNIDYEKLRNHFLPVPPREEQDQIVRYLDWQVSKINRLIAAKRKQIKLLEATTAHYLENIIHKGTRNEQLVETGNPWINTAPKSWKKVRHKNVLTEKKEVVGENHSQYTLLSLTTKGVIIRDTSSGKGKYPSDFSTYQVVNPSDMVFCLFDVDETPRTVGLSTHTGMITGAYTIYETHDALPEFLLYYFISIDNKKGFKPLYSGLRKVIGKDVFSRQAIYLPSIEEQKEIVDAIQIRQAKSRKAIDFLEREIESLHDLRTRLISDVVTGQVDVRGIEVPEFEYVVEANPKNEEELEDGEEED